MAAQVVGTVSAKASALGTTSLAVDKPSGFAAGDVIHVVVAAIGLTGTPSITDFTLLQTLPTSNNIRGFLFGKVAGGSEPASYTISNGASSVTGWAARSFAVQGGDTSSFPTSYEAGQQSTSNSGTSITVTGITMSSAGSLLIGIHVSRGTGATLSSSSGMVDLWVTDTFESRTTRSYYEEIASAGATGNRVFANTASTTNVAGLYGINPSAGGGGGSSVPPKAMYYSRTRAA